MRSTVLAVSLTLAGASVAQSQATQSSASPRDFVPQEVAIATPPQTPAVRLVDAPIGMTRAQSGVDAVKSHALAEPMAAAVDPSTRNTLAIIGAVVVVLALIAFLL